jgi:hypothetical protein
MNLSNIPFIKASRRVWKSGIPKQLFPPEYPVWKANIKWSDMKKPHTGPLPVKFRQ